MQYFQLSFTSQRRSASLSSLSLLLALGTLVSLELGSCLVFGAPSFGISSALAQEEEFSFGGTASSDGNVDGQASTVEEAPKTTPTADKTSSPATAQELLEKDAQKAEAAKPKEELSVSDETKEPPMSDDEWRRLERLKAQVALNGGTGLMWLNAADSGAPGTFRFGVTTGFYAGTGFLCPTCTDRSGQGGDLSDSASYVSGRAQLSATVLPFLEAYASIRGAAAYNSLGVPTLLQSMGDTTLGVKFFRPFDADEIFTFAGITQLDLLSGAGSNGVATANVGLVGLATFDFNNRKNIADRIPLRLHTNLGYVFDNSGTIVEGVEAQRQNTIDRIERFGLDINRTDHFDIGFGVEGTLDWARPFIEWSIALPVNRQGYQCNRAELYSDDYCMADQSSFSYVPSRLTIGSRFHFGFEGLALTAALDIGTGATSNFLEEVAPELPWQGYIGFAYAVDPQPRVIERYVAAPVAENKTYYRIRGEVVDSATTEPVSGALLRFEGRDITGMIASEAGKFTSLALEPGKYTLLVTAEGYKDGSCEATIEREVTADASGAQPANADVASEAQPEKIDGAEPNAEKEALAGTSGVVEEGEIVTKLRCELKAKAVVGHIEGRLINAETNAPLIDAKVTITDKLGRSLELQSDAVGAFRFENIPPGVVTITVEAEGYLKSLTELEIQGKGEIRQTIRVNPRPEKSNVELTKKELKLKKQAHFENGSADLAVDSHAIIEEVAELLSEHPEVLKIEIQGHTDNKGGATTNQELSQLRANAVRNALIADGVAEGRLIAKGYGDTKPIATNATEAGRASNRRVQLVILERE